MKCDFCTVDLEEFEFTRVVCGSFVVADPVDVAIRGDRRGGVRSDGDFIACEECYAFIRNNDRPGLRKRALDRFVERHPLASLARPELETILDEFLKKFWAAKK